ncbi:protein kinase domain-containing protein [Streptomyces sp. TE4109]
MRAPGPFADYQPLRNHDVTTTGVLIGTPAYMAPEALAGTFDQRSDLYSLGCVLYEMVTGRRPFTGTPWHLINQHLKEQPTPLRTLRPDVPVELERLVSRLLAKDPAQRPDSAGVWDALKKISDRHFGATPPRRGPDLAHDIYVSQAEATDGAIIPLRVTVHRTCPACATRTDEKAARACTTRKGEGRIIHEQHTQKVRIPAGIRQGQKLRIRELGGPGEHGGAPGDMYATVHVDDRSAARYSARA